MLNDESRENEFWLMEQEMTAHLSSGHGSICKIEKEMQPYDDETKARAWKLDRSNYVYNTFLDFIKKRKNIIGRTSPNVTTVLHTGTNKRFIEVESGIRSEKMARTIKRGNLSRR